MYGSAIKRNGSACFLSFQVTFLSRSAQHLTSIFPAPARKLASFATLNIEAHVPLHMPGSSSAETGEQP
jgi:hypothetical protein